MHRTIYQIFNIYETLSKSSVTSSTTYLFPVCSVHWLSSVLTFNIFPLILSVGYINKITLTYDCTTTQ